MRILVAYNRYRLRIQGEQIAIDALIDLLEANGHQVDTHIEESVDTGAGFLAKTNAAVSGVCGREAKRRLGRRIDGFKPDLVHFHNLYPRLGMPALAACESFAVPTLISLHNYFLTCPIYKHFRDGRACTECTPINTLPCLINNCRGKFVESLVYAGRSSTATAMGIHHRFGGYIAQSQFAKNFVVKHGVPDAQVHVLRNFVGDFSGLMQGPRRSRPYALFLGRIVAEKGIDDIVALAMRMPSVRIVVAGGTLGPAQTEWPGNVEFLGQLSPSEAQALLKNASCLLFTSRYFEMCPLVLLESMRLGTPVIATRIGGIPELVSDGERGLLYDPGDISALEARVQRLLENKDLRQRLIKNAYEYVISVHSPKAYYQDLIRIYLHAIRRNDRYADSNAG